MSHLPYLWLRKMTAKYFELAKERLGDVHEAKWEYGDQQSI